MKACILASGSKGNSTYIETKNHKILLDMGKNKKYIEDSLKSIGVNPKDIDIILISHTHSDHISALDTFVKRYHTTIYVPEEMYEVMDNLKEYKNIKLYDDLITLNDLKIYAIKSSHDAIASRNFIIEEDNHSIVQITDTGYIKRKYFKLLQNRDAYFMESNHDIEMLEHGPYPDYLKRRVLSDEGHLSNQASGFYLAKLIGNNTKKVYLMHLSEINNTPDIALKTVKKVLKDYDVNFKDIKCANQYEISDVIEV
jgi:phosphoribosyl 1,2-cyclic phosphodiesterase